MKLSTDGKGTFRVTRRAAPGAAATYDFANWTYAESRGELSEDGTEKATLWHHPTARECVPIYCKVCFEGSPWASPPPPETLAARCKLAKGVVAGVVAVTYKNEERESANGSSESTSSDRMAAHKRTYYKGNGAFFESSFHPIAAGKRAADLKYGHRTDIGRVEAYWHVHRDDAVYVNALASVNDADAVKIIDEYIQKPTSTIAFSLGTFAFGQEEGIAELSVVTVPARRGCFGRMLNNVDAPTEDRSADTCALLREMCYIGNEVPDTTLASFDDMVGLKNTERFSKLATITADMLAAHRDLLRLTKSDDGSGGAIEEYIKQGIRQYLSLSGNRTTHRPRILTAGMMAGNDLNPSVKDTLVNLGVEYMKQQLQTTNASRPSTSGHRKKRYADDYSDDSDDERRYNKYMRKEQQNASYKALIPQLLLQQQQQQQQPQSSPAAVAPPQQTEEELFQKFYTFLEKRNAPHHSPPPLLAQAQAQPGAAIVGAPAAPDEPSHFAAEFGAFKNQLFDMLSKHFIVPQRDTLPETTETVEPLTTKGELQIGAATVTPPPIVPAMSVTELFTHLSPP
nr:pro [Herpesvirus DDDp]